MVSRACYKQSIVLLALHFTFVIKMYLIDLLSKNTPLSVFRIYMYISLQPFIDRITI